MTIDRLTVERSQLPDGTPVVNAYAPGLRESTKPLADHLPEIIDFLSDKFGPYPYSSAGNVFVNVNDDGPGTAPATRPVYLGAGNAEFMTLDQVVHEQAHEWYANAVTIADSEDSCLNECFASYATWLWDEEKDGTDLDSRYREQVEEHKDDADWWPRLYQPGKAAGITTYTKGPLALHALRRQVGDAAFNRIIKQWPQKQRGTYASWPDFESFAEKTSGQDLTGFLKAWFHDEGVPADEYLWPGELKP
ncbi:M1 family aminopeptidase [Streptomyces cavernae]|uniref:M1 family aminopeptidase n=1 Tax=Streptomyces cavernae TaxID=2259034 RepID=UPI000FEBB1A1|nr:M1 family aminopeptidase [Streptomyces cavernae]